MAELTARSERIQVPTEVQQEADRGTSIWVVVGAAATGLALSAVILPIILPGLAYSVLGTDVKVFWYLSRATAIVSFGFLWLSMVLGLLITSKTARYFPGAFTANDLHQFLSLAGLTAGLTHGLLLMGDQYFKLDFIHLVLPFSINQYKPLWVGIGQVGFYLWAIVVISFYIRKQLGYKTWRALHFIGFLAFITALAHGIISGTDTGTLGMTITYWVSGASVLFLTLYRILAAADKKPLNS